MDPSRSRSGTNIEDKSSKKEKEKEKDKSKRLSISLSRGKDDEKKKDEKSLKKESSKKEVREKEKKEKKKDKEEASSQDISASSEKIRERSSSMRLDKDKDKDKKKETKKDKAPSIQIESAPEKKLEEKKKRKGTGLVESLVHGADEKTPVSFKMRIIAVCNLSSLKKKSEERLFFVTWRRSSTTSKTGTSGQTKTYNWKTGDLLIEELFEFSCALFKEKGKLKKKLISFHIKEIVDGKEKDHLRLETDLSQFFENGPSTTAHSLKKSDKYPFLKLEFTTAEKESSKSKGHHDGDDDGEVSEALTSFASTSPPRSPRSERDAEGSERDADHSDVFQEEENQQKNFARSVGDLPQIIKEATEREEEEKRKKLLKEMEETEKKQEPKKEKKDKKKDDEEKKRQEDERQKAQMIEERRRQEVERQERELKEEENRRQQEEKKKLEEDNKKRAEKRKKEEEELLQLKLKAEEAKRQEEEKRREDEKKKEEKEKKEAERREAEKKEKEKKEAEERKEQERRAEEARKRESERLETEKREKERREEEQRQKEEDERKRKEQELRDKEARLPSMLSISDESEKEITEHVSNRSPDVNLKVIVVGDSGVGKTNILNRYNGLNFDPSSISTIGVSLWNKQYITKKDQVVHVGVWDTAGQERFRSITRTYYRGTNGVVLVYDITKLKSFTSLAEYWMKEIMESNDASKLQVILVGNKADLEKDRQVSKLKGEQLAKEMKAAFLETSALSNTNIFLAFETLILEILASHPVNVASQSLQTPQPIDAKSASVIVKSPPPPPPSSCC